jgi:hypothetical protein
LEGKGIANNFAKNKNNGKENETRMDNRETMVSSALRELVDRPEERSGIYRTIEAGNTAGSVSAILKVEELEELESRGINPYWDKKKFQNELYCPAWDSILLTVCFSLRYRNGNHISPAWDDTL